MNRKIAIDNVKSGGSTLVVFSENDCVSCSKRGVLPLLELYESGKDFSEYQAVDKVIGKAAAFMYILLRIRSVYGVTVSKSAVALLEKHGIDIEYEILADRIKNRTNTGFCPMESAVMDVVEEDEAYRVIKETMEILKRS